MNENLFQHGRKKQIEKESPLANRMRPRTLEEYVGQEHIIGPGRLLRRAIEADQLSSLIFYGPPGTGKTTLAMVIANRTQSYFITINAVLAGVKEIRQAIADAEERRDFYGQRTTLFVDEVHRWNKAQQDALLPHVEKGTILLIGATTANPYFEVQKALVSRSRIFQLKPLTEDDLKKVVHQTIHDPDRGYGKLTIDLHGEALNHLVNVANGDARSVLNALELAVETTPPNDQGTIVIDLAVAEESIQRRAVLYDKDGDTHYDTISAFIKSLRGSDPDAALYWLAKMVYAGEDAKFIFRRMGIFAGEDIGMADPQAAQVVQSCWSLFERIGMPEGQFPLASAAIYLATAPKSNSVFAFFDALETVKKEAESDVPNHLKDANRDKEGFGHGKGYLYPHSYRNHWVAQQYLPTALQGRLFYQPGDQGYERSIRDEVARKREAQLVAMLEQANAAVQPGEVFSTSPVNRRKDAWLARAAASQSARLAETRAKLFELARIQRHFLVLDAFAGSGLLTWEAVRQTPEGGVWAVVDQAEAAEMLQQQAEQLPAIDRPQIVSGVDEIPSEIKFDRILIRNRFTRYDAAWESWLAECQEKLAADGELVVAQVVPRQGQRLSHFVPDDRWQDENLEAVQEVEQAIFTAADDPLVSWDVEDLVQAALSAGLAVKEKTITITLERRQITLEQFESWFKVGRDDRPSYADHLSNHGFSAEDVQQIKRLYRTHILDQPVEWQTASLFLLLSMPDPAVEK
ncbi:MAG: AAA family ATPase [Ardenticatenaceae bacterium]|nr:AAA family ATPase [Ardenticatenaceae bacterium]